MSLWSKLSGELVDIVEFPDAPADSLVYRFPRYANEIKFGAKLIVREGQGALFVNEGKLADVFTPGTYTLETHNLPILSTLQGWKYGFESPFKAEVYFFSTRPMLNQQWGTQQAVTLEIAGYGLVEIRAFGQAGYHIADPSVFFRQMVGTTGILTDDSLLDYLRGLINSQFTQALTSSKPTVEQLSANLDALDDTLIKSINTKLQPLGFELVQFLIESLSLPPALRDELFEYSRLNKVDLNRLTQMQAAKSITQLASQTSEGGVGAQSMQFGVGLAAAQQVAQAMNASRGASSPPPIDNSQPAPLQYHVVVDGQAQGPLSMESIERIVAQGSLNSTTLVWRPGMAAWAPAASQQDLQPLFPQVPPPLPSTL